MKRSLVVGSLSLALFAAASASEAQTVTGTTPSLIPTTGGSIDIDGMGFGSTRGNVLIGGMLSPVTAWSDTRITCTAPPGAGINVPSIVQVGATTSPPFFVSYAPPSITDATPQGSSTQGGAEITLSGRNFFIRGTLRFNGTPVTARTWTHNAITFALPAGQGSNLPIELTVESQTTTSRYHYGAPSITGINPTSGPASGGNVIVIDGSNFGITPLVTIGGAVCLPITSSHTQIRCTVPAGAGTQPVVVNVAGQSSTTMVSYTYGAVDAGADAASDASAQDAASDATPDASAQDATPDAMPDASPDAASERDATPDASEQDATMDSGGDAGSPTDAAARDAAQSEASADAGVGPMPPGGCGCATPTNTHTQSNGLLIISSIATAIAMASRVRRARR
ncbi:MAG: IPT/TIG domain-containing protein [Polyangiales bacterium]